MKFGFDIDDTLINLREHAFTIYNKKLGTNISLEEFRILKTLEIHEPFGLSDKEGSEMWNSLIDEIYYTNCSPFPHSRETLQELVNQGHEVYYITARDRAHSVRTKQWLKDNGFPVVDDHFYCGMKDSEKIDIIKELNLDFYFDDKPAVLETLSELPLMVYAKDNSYNQHLNIPRITCWSELKEILKEVK